MNYRLFEHFLNYPDQLNAQTLAQIESLVNEYPYCQSLQLLYAKNLNVENNILFSGRLHTAAAYASDRKILKQLIERSIADQSAFKNKAAKKETLQPLPEQSEDKPSFLPVDRQQQPSSGQLLELIKKRLAEIRSEKQQLQPQKSDEQGHSIAKSDGTLRSKADIIEQFIRNEPKISRVRSEFFNPQHIARNSTIDNEEIVTETLANIYARQGNYSKAIKILEKLRLDITEKSSYFATQIKKMKEQAAKSENKSV
ncbi:MAG: hypothetical protein M0R21_03205 [Lentimicrobiaceae bacterium]|nr:hypothetical protein [Lentimicrobiaceae bacterium]